MDNNNLFQQQLDAYVGDFEKIENELNNQLQLLGENIDKGFIQLKSINQNINQITNDLLHSVGTTSSAALISIAFSSIIQSALCCFTSIKEAKQHNKSLDKLLILKQEIAQQKTQSITKIGTSIDKVAQNIRNLIKNEALSKITITDVSKNILDMKLSIMNRTLLIYRNTVYCQLLTQYLQAEYKAWLSGKQYSNIERPTLFNVNTTATKDLNNYLKETGYNLNIPSLFSSQKRDIFGAYVYLSTDSQLLSVYLLDYGMPLNRNEIKKMPKLHNTSLKSFIKSNTAYKTYRSSYYKLNYWIKWFNGYVVVALIIAIILLAIITLFSLTNWWTWIEWTLGIILFFTGSIIVCFNYDYFENSHQRRVENFCLTTRKKMMIISGYIKIFRPNLDKKNILKAGFNGAIKGFINTFD